MVNDVHVPVAGAEVAAEAEPAVEAAPALPPEVLAWLGGPKRNQSYAPDRKRVHRIGKEKPNHACWNWALWALSDVAGGPSREDFWSYVLNPAAQKELPATMAGLSQEVVGDLRALTGRLNAAGLASLVPAEEPADEATQARARPLMKEMFVKLVQLNGFEVVEPEAAAATIVCQYEKSGYASFPDHFWIELAGGVVIQTVPDRPLEVGNESTKWHSADGRLAESAPEYEELRVPVAALKARHIEILTAAKVAAVGE
ncbi:hypothetical protein P5P86_16785 [Nocardioides sp. BP30]|uniref:hypothetical protein n=1 Tax=Nocardioides sp. BP30 TaxID=3036374 RepID=UPI002468848F|nr:hypothetical protein [Nocardioides sp. BP30]WGL51605.1 hypothetical protein P5P86_16785 [Nocardioides sp. BP30]